MPTRTIDPPTMTDDTLSINLPPVLEQAIRRCLDRACERNLALATAESCTGGLLASLLTDIEGCSHVFDRGFIVYSNEAKREMLDISASLLQDHGAVSHKTAVAMAENALEKSRADIAISISGFAGKARIGDEEGLVHYACARRGFETHHREAHYGPKERSEIRIDCIRAAIEMLENMMDE